MIDGLVLGALTWASFVFSFIHFPNLIKRFMLNHFFITDVLGVAATFFLLSSISHSITSVIGSITCGLLINLSLMAKRTIGEMDAENAINTK